METKGAKSKKDRNGVGPREVIIKKGDRQTIAFTTTRRLTDVLLENAGLIERTPGAARSIRVLIKPEDLPYLE